MLGRLGQDDLSRASCLPECSPPGGGQRKQVQSIAADIADAAGGPARVELWPQSPRRPGVVREVQVRGDVCTRGVIVFIVNFGAVDRPK
jgi:hypothetical protein